MTFSEWLKDARKAAGMTREELAQKADIHKAGISAWEEVYNAVPRYREEIAKLADALGVDPDEAFYAAGRTPPDIRGRILAGGPPLWRELRKDFFGKENK